MNYFTPRELVQNYALAGEKKCVLPIGRLLALSVLAGILIAMGSAATNTVSYAVENVSLARLICGLLFPFGLGMVVLMGAELFTGNCLICISVLEKKARLSGMVRNLSLCYLGNLLGALLVAAGCALFGQLQYSGGALGVFTIKLAAAKCVLPFGDALVKGFLCNILVALGVLMAGSAKDSIGKIAGAFLPVAFFVFCGFEHCVANMYYIPAGLFALQVPAYAAAAAQAGIDVAALTWGNFFVVNLLPVTIGNILGGVFVGMLMWYGHRETEK